MQKITKQKKMAFVMVFTIIIILFFIGVEGVLRLFSIGSDYSPFVINDIIPEYYLDNQTFISKYHADGKRVSSTARNFFPLSDTDRTLRGFVVGGSTAQGYPYPSNQSFSKVLEVALKASGRYDEVSVVNLGFSAMSSFYVSDSVKKIIPYKPDFIVLYSGHNELYGTISATTGKSFFSKKLYLALKEVRLFQLLFNLMSGNKGTGANSVNLMAQQFQDNRIPIDSEINSLAEDFYRKNLKSVIDITSRNNIPLFVVEPVSNLIDMPPFHAQPESRDEDLLAELQKAYEISESSLLEQFLIERASEIEKSSNAHIAYMAGLIQRKLGTEDYLQSFIRAKDLDSAPFRARSSLIRQLSEHNGLSEGNVHYISLMDVLLDQYGPEIFSNEIFIDHLHFNMEGQKIVGRVLAESVGETFSFSSDEQSRMTALLEQEEILFEKLHMTDFSEVFPYWSVSSILMGSPYSEMRIKYKLPEIEDLFPENGLAIDTNLRQKMFLSVRNTNDIILFIYNYYLENEIEKCLPFINSLIFNYPGNPAGYIFLGDYFTLFEKTDRNVQTVISSYFKALYLSGFEENIYLKLKKYLEENDKSEILKQLNYEYERQL